MLQSRRRWPPVKGARRAIGFLAVLLLVHQPGWAMAAVKLPAAFSSHMVLQRDQPVPVWGWDDPGTKVTVSLAGKSATAVAAEDGRWRLSLPALAAGGPHDLFVRGSDTLELTDVLVGEVWLCSGQSNMEWPVRASLNAPQEIANADHPRIRHIKIRHTPAATPQTDVGSSGWQVCSPDTVGLFTAVGYYFARQLEQELDVPIGLIGCNWGGTRIEPWIPPVGFQSVPALRDVAEQLGSFPRRNKAGKAIHQSPLALYNGMVHPLVPYAIRGVLWYQGESNNGEGMVYHEKMKALIAGWRSLWQRPEMPFYYVQLAPFHYRGDPTRLAGIWEAQLATLSVPNTGMAVTVDIGNLRNIHPINKQEVGRRLALWALAGPYQRQKLVHSGPLFRSLEREGGKVRIAFDHVGAGLVSRDGKPLSWFTVAGEDGECVEATAEIDGDTLVVWAESVARPTAVRFAWNQDAQPNLSNADGLPASPFRAAVP